jgi:DeoR/GlpR family transcriptional regulator of sugar metabolism
MEPARQGEAELLCVGGELRKINGTLVGGQALGIFATVRADFAFIGASGLEATDEVHPIGLPLSKSILNPALA